jgi:hypothetical protein
LPDASLARSCCQRVITASCELSIHVNPLPVWLTARPTRGLLMMLAQGRGVRESVIRNSLPSSVK